MWVAMEFVVVAYACIGEFYIAVDKQKWKYDVTDTTGQPNREEKDDEHACCDCRGKFALQVHKYMC